MADEGSIAEINESSNVNNLLGGSDSSFDFDRILDASLDSVDLELSQLQDQQATDVVLDDIEVTAPERTSGDDKLKQQLQQALEECDSTMARASLPSRRCRLLRPLQSGLLHSSSVMTRQGPPTHRRR